MPSFIGPCHRPSRTARLPQRTPGCESKTQAAASSSILDRSATAVLRRFEYRTSKQHSSFPGSLRRNARRSWIGSSDTFSGEEDNCRADLAVERQDADITPNVTTRRWGTGCARRALISGGLPSNRALRLAFIPLPMRDTHPLVWFDLLCNEPARHFCTTCVRHTVADREQAAP